MQTLAPRFQSLSFILALAGSVLLFPFIGMGYLALWYAIIPAYSAEFSVADADVKVSLRFYYAMSVRDGGRYVTVRTPRGAVTTELCGFDFSHHARTSVYLIEDKKIAVLGSEGGCDALVSLSPLQATAKFNLPSDNWRYLGAFDFGVDSYNRRGLRFFPAGEQRECLPGRHSVERLVYSRPRESAWANRCGP